MGIDRRIGLCAVLIALTAGVGLGEPLTNKPMEGSTVSSNGSPSVPVAKSPLVLKGLYGKRSKSGNELESSLTESAVIRGLRWLQTAQNKDGSWGVGADEFDAVTGVALLAFLGHGETSSSQEFGATVGRGMDFLVAEMRSTNSLARKGQSSAVGHAISTWAVCREYSMIRPADLWSVGVDGSAVILKGQNRSGLWDDSYGMDEGGDDTDVAVWQILALQSGSMGSAERLYDNCLRRASEAMTRRLENKPDAGTTVGAVLCLQLCGEGRSPACRTGMVALATMTPDWETPAFKDPIFRWYLADQAFFHQGGQEWARWNRLLFPMLLKHQVVSQDASGKEVGYWDSPGGGERFGRVYSTALCLLMLDVFRSPLTYQPKTRQSVGNADDEDIVIRFD